MGLTFKARHVAFIQVTNQIGLEFDSVSFDSALSYAIRALLFQEKVVLAAT